LGRQIAKSDDETQAVSVESADSESTRNRGGIGSGSARYRLRSHRLPASVL